MLSTMIILIILLIIVILVLIKYTLNLSSAFNTIKEEFNKKEGSILNRAEDEMYNVDEENIYIDDIIPNDGLFDF